MVLSVVLHRVETAIAWEPMLGAALLSITLVLAAGWVPILHLMSRKPMDILRGE